MNTPPRDLADATTLITSLETENERLTDAIRRVIRELENETPAVDGRFYAGWLRRIVEKEGTPT